MMIESDLLFAHLKESDWLKESSEAILTAINSGRLKRVYVSREAIHELYYVVSRMGLAPAEVLARIGALTAIRNLTWTTTTTDTDMLALSLIATYKLTSVFDAYHAAACLLDDPERTIVSTDSVYEAIPQIKRVDPRELEKRLKVSDERGE